VAIPQDLDRRPLAVAVTTDGRRVQLPVGHDEVPPLSLIRSILAGIEVVIDLITGSRRENGGTRRGARG
jgi:hypothetical protein